MLKDDITDNPKFLMLVNRLSRMDVQVTPRTMALGILASLYGQAIAAGDPVYADGDQVDAAAGVLDGDVVEALLETGLIDVREDIRLEIHNWWDHITDKTKQKKKAVWWAVEHGIEITPRYLKFYGLLDADNKHTQKYHDLVEELRGEKPKTQKQKPKPKKSKAELPKPDANPEEFALFWKKWSAFAREHGKSTGNKKAALDSWNRHVKKETCETIWLKTMKAMQEGRFSNSAKPEVDFLPNLCRWLTPSYKGASGNVFDDDEPVSKFDDPGYQEFLQMSNEEKQIQQQIANDEEWAAEYFPNGVPWWLVKEDANGKDKTEGE